MKRPLTLLRRALYWAVPLVIFWIIFSRLDLGEFRARVAGANIWLVALGIAYYPLVIVIGAVRWHTLLGPCNRGTTGLGFALKHYWIGLALGLFAPASLGWDAYRIVVSGRRSRRYGANLAVIVAEKLLALVTCMTLIVVMYPLVRVTASPDLRRIVHTAYTLLLAVVVLFALLNIAARNRLFARLTRKLETALSVCLTRLAHRRGLELTEDHQVSLRALLSPFLRPRLLISTVGMSFLIQLVAAIGNQVFFRALGYPLPFTANLFVLPVLYFVFLLPVSFGSLGIREGTYIVLYGLFGVPPETALLVSFFNFSGLMLNCLIGGALMLTRVSRELP